MVKIAHSRSAALPPSRTAAYQVMWAALKQRDGIVSVGLATFDAPAGPQFWVHQVFRFPDQCVLRLATEFDNGCAEA